MSLRNIINWVLDTNIFNLLGVILILLIIFGYLWLIYDLLVNSKHYPEGDIRITSNWDSFEHKRDRLKLVTKFIFGFCIISSTIYFYFTQ